MRRLLPALAGLSLLATPAAGRDLTLTGTAQDAETLAILAVDYLDGNGVEQSNIQALKWMIVARAHLRPVERITPGADILRCGYIFTNADDRIWALESVMSPTEIAQAQRIAAQWLEAHQR